MTIDEIFISNKISVRTRNICKNNGLYDLQSIINFYNDKNSFLNLRNCGRKSNEELISLCIQKDDSFNLSNLNGYKEIISNTFNNLNKSVDKMFQKNEISFRTRNICKSYNLIDLDSIINHFKIYQSFLNIKNCGDKSNEELILICKKNGINTNKEKLKTLEVDNTHNLLKLHFNNLSSKSKNYIKNYLKGDISIKNISEKIIFNSEFKYSNIRNFGEKSIQELKCFFDYTKFILNSNHDLKINQNQFLTYNSNVITSDFNCTDDEIEEIDNYIKINLNKLSIRSSKIISSYLKGKFNTHNFIDKILKNNDFYSQALKNTSEYSKKELNDFIASIEKCIANYFKCENQLDFHKNINYFEESKLILRDQFFEKQSIFKLVDFKISQNKIFNKNENIIFRKGFKIYQNQVELTLIEIANELNLTRERVRQKRKSILENLFKGFEFIKNINEDIFQLYNIDSSQLILDLDYDLINKDYKTNFSKEFITFIIYIFISDKFELVGELEDVFLPKYKNSKDRHNWSKFYIINKDLTKIFDFNNFIQDLNERLNERIEETYSFQFNSYLSNFMKEYDNTQITLLQPVVEKIINEEFDIFIDFNENIVFERNTVKQVYEYAIEALEKLGVPSNIEEIFNYIIKDFPEITKSKEALRGSLQRTPEVIYFGRSSTYGLKKWETEKEGIKGGTIKDIILDYLENKNYPVHIIELLNEVHRYREATNAKNIITNLKLDPQNQFIIFNQSFIGLSKKSYNSKLSNLPKFLGKTITHYIKQNGRMNRLNAEKYFADQLDISLENMKYIIEYLIENNFIKIDNQNNLTI